MKVPRHHKSVEGAGLVAVHHYWSASLLAVMGFVVLVVAGFWIRKCKSSSSGVGRHEYSALQRADSGGATTSAGDKYLSDGAHQLCDQLLVDVRHFLATKNRFHLKASLENIGSRADKRWFIARDMTLGAERVVSVVPLTSACPIEPSEATRRTVASLFRGLQHPYIHPVLDVDFWESRAVLVSPLNPAGSLRDLIYASPWHEGYESKYCRRRRGQGLPLWQVQRLGRQVLEALLFLRERGFPAYRHLHSGNVILQDGVARLSGLESALLGVSPRAAGAATSPDALAFGYLLFEMTAGYELPRPPSPAHLQLELERVPRVADVLRFIFQDGESVPTLEDLLLCELFRGVELRELRGINVAQCRAPPDVVHLLDQVRRCSATLGTPASPTTTSTITSTADAAAATTTTVPFGALNKRYSRGVVVKILQGTGRDRKSKSAFLKVIKSTPNRNRSFHLIK